MEPTFSRLIPLSFSLFFTVFAFFVDSQPSNSSPPPPPPPPQPSPSVSHLPPPSLSPAPAPDPPPMPPPPEEHRWNQTKHHKRRRRPPPPQHSHNHKFNTGKKIGLLFIGFVIILQFGAVGFLIFEGRQVLKVNGTYETCSS